MAQKQPFQEAVQALLTLLGCLIELHILSAQQSIHQNRQHEWCREKSSRFAPPQHVEFAAREFYEN